MVEGTPEKFYINWRFVFADEQVEGMRLGEFRPDYTNCLSGDALEVYTEHYPEEFTNVAASIAVLVNTLYHLGKIPEEFTCRQYFYKLIPECFCMVDM